MRDDDPALGCEHVECALYEFWMRGGVPATEGEMTTRVDAVNDMLVSVHSMKEALKKFEIEWPPSERCPRGNKEIQNLRRLFAEISATIHGLGRD